MTKDNIPAPATSATPAFPTKKPASPSKAPSSPTKAAVSPTKTPASPTKPTSPVKMDRGKGKAVEEAPIAIAQPAEPAGFDLSLLLGGDLPDSDDDELDFIPDQSDEEATEEEDSDYEAEQAEAGGETGAVGGASSSSATVAPKPPIGMISLLALLIIDADLDNEVMQLFQENDEAGEAGGDVVVDGLRSGKNRNKVCIRR
jgi:hypothetical protein